MSVCESNASLLIIRIINREAFDSHTDPLFKENLILKFENIYLLYLGKFMYLYSSNLLYHTVLTILLHPLAPYMVIIQEVLIYYMYHFVEQNLGNFRLAIKVLYFLIH